MADENQPTSHYSGEAGEDYVRHRQSDVYSIGNQINASFFLPYLNSTDTVLDFGAGNGGLMLVVRDHVHRVEGMEVNPAARSLAAEVGFDLYETLDGVPNGKFDVVYTNHVLEHIPDVPGVLAGLRAKLKPRGRILVKLPYDDWRDPHQRSFAADDVDQHLHTWTPRLFANNLYLAGYDVQQCRIVTHAWDPRLFWTRRLKLDGLAFRCFSILRKRRQLFAVAVERSG